MFRFRRRRRRRNVSQKKIQYRRIRRINRYSTNKRIVVSPVRPRPLFHRSPSLVTHRSKWSTPVSKKLKSKFNPLRSIKYIVDRIECEERKKRADNKRRSNFFRAKGRGGASRPEHNRRHKKC